MQCFQAESVVVALAWLVACQVAAMVKEMHCLSVCFSLLCCGALSLLSFIHMRGTPAEGDKSEERCIEALKVPVHIEKAKGIIQHHKEKLL